MLLGIPVGLVASFVFLVIVARLLVPKVTIGTQIAKGKSTRDGRTIYRIKIVNRSRRYPITDIRAQLHAMRSHPTPDGGEIWKSAALELKRSDPLAIEPYNKKDSHAYYAFRFVTYGDVEAALSGDGFVRFRMLCRHGLSGVPRMFERDFPVASVVDGEFESGVSTVIRPRLSLAESEVRSTGGGEDAV